MSLKIVGAPRKDNPNKWDYKAVVTYPKGARFKSAVWEFSTQSTRKDLKLNAPGFLWTQYGQQRVHVTIMDTKGGKQVASLTHTLKAPVLTPPAPTQPPFTGHDLIDVADFDQGNNSTKKGAANYGFYLKADLIGQGSAQTVMRIRTRTSTKKAAVPSAGNGKGGLANATNNMYIVRVDGDNRTIRGLTIMGTEQGHLYNGLRCHYNAGLTIEDVVVQNIPGNSSANPGETFFVNLQRTSGRASIKGLQMLGGTGWAKGAAGLGFNSVSATTTIEGLVARGFAYSAGIATWQQRGPIDVYGYVHDSPTRALGAERLAAPIRFHDPQAMQIRTVKGKHDATYTWGDHEGGDYRDGEIVWDFSNEVALMRWLGPKRPVFWILTNPQSVKQGIKKSVRVLVGGKDRTADLLKWSGA